MNHSATERAAMVGDERPKQFCPILGDETLLDQTRKRPGQAAARFVHTG